MPSLVDKTMKAVEKLALRLGELACGSIETDGVLRAAGALHVWLVAISPRPPPSSVYHCLIVFNSQSGDHSAITLARGCATALPFWTAVALYKWGFGIG